MHMLPRMLWHQWFIGRRGRKIALTEVSRSAFRVWPTDLDVYRHMNNGKYLSIMDVGRYDLTQRTGIFELMKRENWYSVVVAQTITYRKSLNPWKRFVIESRIIGMDEQAVYMEQRFVRPAPPGSGIAGRPEIYARAVVRARILKRTGGLVPVEEILEKVGTSAEEMRVPEEILA